jgi:hypothetical protein
MMFANFYQYGIVTGELIEATGDRSVVVIDGRLSNENVRNIAESECAKRGYVAWAVFRGETFTRSKQVSQINYINRGKPVRNPAWLSAHN